jgi:pyruvate ferredoxin oxidoreductase delta subunit
MKDKKRINLAVEPGSSRVNKTGAWRSLKPETNLNTCIGCGLCAKVCPEACIEMIESEKAGGRPKPKTDYDYCKGCGLCAHECPVKAISMKNDF